MKKRSYKITFELREGYAENAKEHTSQFAASIIKGWLEDRVAANMPVVSGLLQEGTLFYPLVGADTAVAAARCMIFAGELSSRGDEKRRNKEVRRTLEALAGTIKEALRQKTVFVTYRDKHWNI